MNVIILILLAAWGAAIVTGALCAFSGGPRKTSKPRRRIAAPRLTRMNPKLFL
jgi:hypothetical protein